MTVGPTRIAPFLAASVALHAVALVALGPERLSIAPASAGHEGHTIAVHLVAAGRPDRANDDAAAANRETTDRAAAEAAQRSNPQPEARARKPERTVAESERRVAERADSEPSSEHTGSTEAGSGENRPEEQQRQAEPPRAVGSTDTTVTAASTKSGKEKPAEEQAARKDNASRSSPRATPTHPPATAAQAPTRRRRPERKHHAPTQTQRRRLADASDHAREASGGGDNGNAADSVSAEQVRSEIATEIARHFRYPRLARSHGWEGRVVLGFRVRPDGTITDIRVVESSGRAILDRAAVAALEQVERVPSLAERALAGPLALRMPVTYRLQSA